MKSLNSSLFCLTADFDVSSDFANEDFLSLIAGYGFKPTVFASQRTSASENFIAEGSGEIGAQLDFVSASPLGADPCSVIERAFNEFPEAKTFRSRGYVDSTGITQEMVKRGIRYDSNLCLYLQSDLQPLRHSSGLIRFPVFWQDDVHWLNTNGDWSLERYLPVFLSPGLKVLNVNPLFIAANIPNQDYYEKVKGDLRNLTAETLSSIRYSGDGARTFFCQLLDHLASIKERIYSLGELYKLFAAMDAELQAEDAKGRTTAHSEGEYLKYWRSTDAEKQELLKEEYEQRNAIDIYATSRDYNVRELEIDVIARSLGGEGSILDLGCGNGYTLLSLAERLEGRTMLGVDFSENLVGGANQLRDTKMATLLSRPEFRCANAIEYIKGCESESLGYIITERFLLNMPSVDVQKTVIREIFRAIKPGGAFVMCEGSEDGFENLNTVRAELGLSRVPATSQDNVSSIRFKDHEIEAFAREVGFSLTSKQGFSFYFAVSRVLHPLLVAPQKPRFDARINDVTMQIQKQIPYSPGLGANTVWVLHKL